MKRSGIVVLLVGLAVFLVGAAALIGLVALRAGSGNATSAASSSADPLVQQSSGGGIEVTATLATPGRLETMDQAKVQQVDLGSQVAIILDFTTHQGDLRTFDFAAASRLLTNGQEEKPIRWLVTNDDSHHLEGLLVFAREPRATTKLALRDLGGVGERLFEFPGQD